MIYGIEHTKELCATLLLSPPSRCAEAFRTSQADIALVPVGALPDLSDYKIVTSFCIGASAPVRTVTIMSNDPIEECTTLWLDGHSCSSVLLAKILCANYWKITPQYQPLDHYDNLGSLAKGNACLLIGDKVFDYESRFTYHYDLAEIWQQMTGLPMVFAVWIARNNTPQSVIDILNKALEMGVRHVKDAIDYYGHSGKPYAYDYLTKNIDFVFDHLKRQALELYWQEGIKFHQKVNPG